MGDFKCWQKEKDVGENGRNCQPSLGETKTEGLEYC
jgi:hypothetical protein